MYYVTQGYSDDRARDCAEGARHARTAVELDSNDPTVLSMAGHALGFHAREWETSVHLLERSIMLNPSSAFAYTYAGWANCYAGAAQRALGYFDTALQLSPIDRHCFLNSSGKALALMMLGRYEDAVCWGQRSLREEPNWTSGYRPLAAGLAQLGRQEQAADVVRRLLERDPGYRISVGAAQFRRCEGFQRYVDGMLKAGLTL